MKKNYRDLKNKGVQYAYLLDSIYSDEVDVTTMTDSELLQYAYETFVYEKFNRPNERKRGFFNQVTDWLQGLCIVSIEYRDYQIGEILTSWGFEASDKNVMQWWSRSATNLISLWKKEGLC